MSYTIPESPTAELSDVSYDGKRQDNLLTDGLGRLIDGEVGADNYRLDMGDGRGNRWVDTRQGAKCRNWKYIFRDFRIFRLGIATGDVRQVSLAWKGSEGRGELHLFQDRV